jgi:hypothetical protein
LQYVHFADYLGKHCLVADPDAADTFFMIHAARGMYKSTDKGITWTLISVADFMGGNGTFFNGKLRYAPGIPGHMWCTAGPVGSVDESVGIGGIGGSNGFKRSTDNGVTWTAVPNVAEVADFAFGKTYPGASYPTLYIHGYVDAVGDATNASYYAGGGLWKTHDAGGTWIKISGRWPRGWLDPISRLGSDWDNYGRVYFGTNGSGFSFAKLTDETGARRTIRLRGI